MSYYKQGFVQYRSEVNEPSWHYTVSSKTIDDDHKGLLILKYKNPKYGDDSMYTYDLVALKSGWEITGYNNDVEFVDALLVSLYKYSKFQSKIETMGYGEAGYPPANYDNLQPVEVNQGVGTLTNKGDTLFNTDLPIFLISAGDNGTFKKINNYVDNGDDSGAINYSDLHPYTLNLKVYMDGSFPNLTIVKSENEPTPSTFSNSYVVGIQSTVDVGNDERFTTNFDINSAGYISYSSYENSNPLTDVTYKLKVTIENDGKIESVDSLFVVKKDGNIGETTSGISDSVTIEYYPNQQPNNNPYPEENDAKWNVEPTTNEFSGANTLTKTYEINTNGVIDLGKFMWSSTFKDNIFSLIQSPIENIVSLKAMPLSGEGVGVEKIKIGNVQSEISGAVVSYADGIKKTVNSKPVKIPRLFNNFIDFTSIDIMIYLPFIGFKQLDPVLYVNRNIWLEYVYDTIYGNVLAIISVADKDGNRLVHDVFQANCGIDIAITSTNRGQIESGYVRGALGTINDIISGNLLGAANETYNSMTQQFHSQSNGVGNASLMNKMDMTARLIIKRPQFFEPNNYGHIFGYPCHQYKTLSEFTNEKLNTFVKCENFICSEINDALDEEKEELKQLMESGVFA